LKLKKIDAYTIPYGEYVKLSKKQIEKLLKEYIVLGIKEYVFDNGDLILIPNLKGNEEI
jgi:hypothetical protein